MEPITWNFKPNENQSPSENIKRLLKISSMDSLEFTTPEKFSEKPGHVYSISSLSMLGDPSTVDDKLFKITNELRDWLNEYIIGDESFVTKIYDLKLSVFLLNEFLTHNRPFVNFITTLSNTFVLTSSIDMRNIDATSNELLIETNHIDEINKHLQIRGHYFFILKEYCLLMIDKINLKTEYPIRETEKDTRKELQLLEVWLSLEKLGFLNYETNHLKKAELRKSFMNIFNCDDANYKKNRSALINKKNRVAVFLNHLVNAFENFNK